MSALPMSFRVASNPEQAFQSAIAAAGLTPPADIQPGKWIKFPGYQKGPKNRAGWCFMFDDMRGGRFGDYSTGIEANWQAGNATPYTNAERESNRQHFAAVKAQREAEALQRHESAAVKAAQQLALASSCTQHPYLKAKGVQGHGVKVDAAGGLIVPMIDTSGKTYSLQTIEPNGDKLFMPGGRVKACYHPIGKPAGVIVVCEGYATGASIHESTGHAVAIAFDAGNLGAVAAALHRKYPTFKIIMAADDDHLNKVNTGMTKAKAAAQAVGGLVAVPDFGANRPDRAKDFNDLHQLAGAGAVKVCFDAASAVVNDWPEPTEIVSQLPAAPKFDAAALLPKALADFVLDEADRMPCSPDYIAAALVVCLGSVIGAKTGLKPKRRDDWIVVPNLWGGIVGDPSSKKSPALSTVTRFLDRLEAREAEKLVNATAIYEAEKAAFEAHQSAVKASMKRAAGGAKPDGLRMAAAVSDLQGLQAPEEPHAIRYKSNDSSIEKLGDILSRNPQGIMIFRDELTGLLASWEREGHEGDRAFYLESWNGTGSFNIDRIGRGEQFVKTLCLSIFGGIQPDKIESYLAGIASSLDNDGRVQRFQVMVYPDPVPWTWCDRYPVKGAREAVRDVFDRLSVFDPVQDGATPADDFVKLSHFQFDDEAQEVFIEWCTQLNQVHIANEQDPLMKQHFGKFEKLFCSLALVLHLAEGNIGAVKIESALRAAAWCDYLAGHARRIYGMVEGAKVATAKMISRRIKEGKLKAGFTVRDLLRKHWAGLTTSLQAESALMILEEHHYIKPYEVQDVPYRPTVRYQINPALIEVTS